MLSKNLKAIAVVSAVVGVSAFAASGASARTSHARTSHAQASHPHKRHLAARGGSQRLVSDGPGTGFGFHHDPLPFRVGAWQQRYRQANATHQAVIDDALTSGGYYGFPGDSVYGAGDETAYGVFNGADGYGSPYFAGFYGPAGGTDYGPFGHTYDD